MGASVSTSARIYKCKNECEKECKNECEDQCDCRDVVRG